MVIKKIHSHGNIRFCFEECRSFEKVYGNKSPNKLNESLHNNPDYKRAFGGTKTDIFEIWGAREECSEFHDWKNEWVLYMNWYCIRSPKLFWTRNDVRGKARWWMWSWERWMETENEEELRTTWNYIIREMIKILCLMFLLVIHLLRLKIFTSGESHLILFIRLLMYIMCKKWGGYTRWHGRSAYCMFTSRIPLNLTNGTSGRIS